jgi:hypothetical protein
MLKDIKNLNNVNAFVKQLIKESVNFHPDEDFKNYIDIETKLPTYSKEEAELRNKLLDQCFEVCEKEGVDIYDFTMEIILIETGLDKSIPLPSQQYSE